MNKKLFLAGMLACVLAFGLVLVGCATGGASVGGVQKVGWSEYITIPNKDYTVVGIVVLRAENMTAALNTDLLEEAKKQGADDVINIRIDTETDSSGKQKVIGVSAVAIKYGETIKTPDGNPVMKDSKDSSDSGSDTGEKGERKKFLGIF